MDDIIYNIPLILLDNPLFNDLFTRFTHIDKTKIIKITYERKINKLKYEKYDEITNEYQDIVSDNRINQFIFNIYVNYSESPIIITCDDSRNRNYLKLSTYRWIPALSTNNSNRILWKFIINGSLNSYDFYLELLGKTLAHIVNNNIVLLEDKILTYNECPINLTKYDYSDNVILLYPCLHSVSNNAHSTGNVQICPICRNDINDIQMLSFDEFNKIYIH